MFDPTLSEAEYPGEDEKTKISMSKKVDRDEKNELPEGFVPSELDVICGWARQNYHHTGNRRLRNVILSNVDKYVKARTKTEKGQVIGDIVEMLQRESPTGVGFVKLNTKTGRWFYIGTEKAKDKIGHALRKAAKEGAKQRDRPSQTQNAHDRRRGQGNSASEPGSARLHQDYLATTQMLDGTNASRGHDATSSAIYPRESHFSHPPSFTQQPGTVPQLPSLQETFDFHNRTHQADTTIFPADVGNDAASLVLSPPARGFSPLSPAPGNMRLQQPSATSPSHYGSPLPLQGFQPSLHFSYHQPQRSYPQENPHSYYSPFIGFPHVGAPKERQQFTASDLPQTHLSPRVQASFEQNDNYQELQQSLRGMMSPTFFAMQPQETVPRRSSDDPEDVEKASNRGAKL